MSTKIDKTIELLAENMTANDLWNDTIDQRPSFMFFNDNQEHKLRFLGPFVQAERFYVPTFALDFHEQDRITQKDYINGNTPLFKEIFNNAQDAVMKKMELYCPRVVNVDSVNFLNKLNEAIMALGGKVNDEGGEIPFGLLPPPPRDSRRSQPRTHDARDRRHAAELMGYKSLIHFLNLAMSGKRWQNCRLINAFSEADKTIRICAVAGNLSNSIGTAVMKHTSKYHVEYKDVKLSGIFGHDLTISKSGHGKTSTHEVRLSKEPSYLKEEDIRFILNRGLIDIPEFLKQDSPTRHYIYRSITNYKMPDELCAFILEDVKRYGATKESECIHEQFGDLPESALEETNGFECFDIDV